MAGRVAAAAQGPRGPARDSALPDAIQLFRFSSCGACGDVDLLRTHTYLSSCLASARQGGALAALSGILMSGLGYALWYAILPRLAASTAAIAQLSVPILAAIGGIVLLGEALTARFIIAAIIVLGGIGLSVVAPRMRA